LWNQRQATPRSATLATELLLAGSGKREGIAVNNKTKGATYMKMAGLQAALGMGIKKFQQVWAFEDASALDKVHFSRVAV
jgi:hypothetical protein